MLIFCQIIIDRIFIHYIFILNYVYVGTITCILEEYPLFVKSINNIEKKIIICGIIKLQSQVG